MEAKDSFTLHWCEEHKNWYQFNCPDCMIDGNEEDIKQQGRREVVEWIERHGRFNRNQDDEYWGYFCIEPEDFEELKEWGL